MKLRTKRRLLTLLIGALALTAAASTASANSFSVNEDEFEIIWRPLTLEVVIANIECDVTFLGHFHSRTISKTPGTLIADIDHARVANCEGGILAFLDETFPWNLRFESWSGTLPIGITNIGIIFNNPRFRIEASTFADCLISPTGNAPRGDIAIAGSVATTVTADPDVGILVNDIGGGLSFLCDDAEFMFFVGQAVIKDLDQAVDIDVSLV